MKKTRVLVLSGGWSSERAISLKSGSSVAKGLKKAGFRVSCLDLKGKRSFQELFRKKFDVAFLCIHGKFGEDGGIQAVLEGMGIPYTGSGVLASALAMDKIFAKKIFVSEGIPTPRYQVLHKSTVHGPSAPINIGARPRPAFAQGGQSTVSLSFPVVVKPSSEGSAIGVGIAGNKNELAAILRSAFRYGNEVIVEKYISGKELSVGILGNKALAVIELKPRRAFYDFKAKYTPGFCEHIIPAPLVERDYAKVQELALHAHRALGCRDYSRVDFRMGSSGIYVLEVNTIPGMTELSLFPESAKASGIGFEELLARIVMMARSR